MIREKIGQLIIDACLKNNLIFDSSKIILDTPRIKLHGDLSTNFSLMIAKLNKKSPIEIANLIKLDLQKNEYINKIEIINPGFINIFLGPKIFIEYAQLILQKDEISFDQLNSVNILFEAVSANPTGYLHIGHARNAIISQLLVSINQAIGNKVEICYYINDAGTQMDNLANSVYYQYHKLILNKAFKHINLANENNFYKGSEIIEVAEKLKVKYQDKFFQPSYPGKLPNKNHILEIQDFAEKFFLDEIKCQLRNLGINISSKYWISERNFQKESKKILSYLEEQEFIITQDDGSKLLLTEAYGDDKNRIVVKTNGDWTYLVSDIALHNWKYSLNFDKYINIFGADHHGYLTRLKASLEMLKLDSNKLEICEMQLVKFIKDKQEMKMSKRKGTSVHLKDFIEKIGLSFISSMNNPNKFKEVDLIGISMIKCMIISRPLNSKINFDFDMTKTKVLDSPYFYFLYGFVRTKKILNNASKFNFPILNKKNLNIETSMFETFEEKALLLAIDKFKATLSLAAKENEPHLIYHEFSKFIGLFHKYYESEKIIDENDITKTYAKLNFIYIINLFMGNIFNILGLQKIDEM